MFSGLTGARQQNLQRGISGFTTLYHNGTKLLDAAPVAEALQSCIVNVSLDKSCRGPMNENAGSGLDYCINCRYIPGPPYQEMPSPFS